MTSKPEFKKITGDEISVKAEPMDKEAMEKEIKEVLKEAVAPVAPPKPEPEAEPETPKPEVAPILPKKVDPRMLRNLRKNDRSYNHTCRSCLKRKEVDNFYRGKKDQVCIDCGGK